MINILFSPNELKKLKKCLAQQKKVSTNKTEIDGLYKSLSGIENRNAKNYRKR